MKSLFLFVVSIGALLAQSADATWNANPVLGPVSRGDQNPAPQALLNAPWGIVADSSGNVYIAESKAGVIRRVRASDGNIETIAGTGSQIDGVEGSPAINTTLVTPSLLVLDSSGALLFADSTACRIRKILGDGTILNVAGTGHCSGTTSGRFGGGSGREAPPLQTDLGHVSGLTFDPSGRLVFSESDTHQVRWIDTDGIVRVVAGTGQASFGGDGNLANAASLNGPAGLAYDPAGNLYIADAGNCRVRMVDGDGNISTVAGNGNCPSRTPRFAGGPATRTSIGVIAGMVYDPSSNSIFIASPGMARLLQYDLSAQQISSVLGNGSVGIPDFTQPPSQFTTNEVTGVTLAPGGGLLATATTSFQAYLLVNNTVSSFAGRWPTAADILRPTAACTRPDGTLIVIDTGTERLLNVDPSSGSVTLFAGADTPTGSSTGDKHLAVTATIASPKRVFCAASGEVYLSQSTNIRKIDTQGIITTVRSGLGNPVGLLIDANGLLVYSDTVFSRVYSYNFTNAKTNFVAGNGIPGYSGDGGAATSAQLYYPTDLAMDGNGNLYIADVGNAVVRELLASDGTMQTVMGSTALDYSYINVSGMPATSIGIGFVNSLAVDSGNNLYVAENNRLSQVTPDGTITVLLGYIGEDNSGNQFVLGQPLFGTGGLTFGADGTLYFTLNQTAALISLAPPPPPQ